MRSLHLLEQNSVCDHVAVLNDSAIPGGSGSCPLLADCTAGRVVGHGGLQCVPRTAQEVARNVLSGRVAPEVELRELRQSPLFRPGQVRFIDPYAGQVPGEATIDASLVMSQIRQWVAVLLDTPVPEPVAPADHCKRHSEYTEGCSNCGMARLVMLDRTDVVWPGGRPARVPRDQCRCPVLRVGDFCPVHGG